MGLVPPDYVKKSFKYLLLSRKTSVLAQVVQKIVFGGPFGKGWDPQTMLKFL